MNVVLRNSHVDRIVHPPDWPHAKRVREAWKPAPSGIERVMLSRLMDDLPNIFMRAHWSQCRRCATTSEDGRSYIPKSMWRVWVPEFYIPRMCDVGPCPVCDQWRAPQVLPQRDSGPTWDSALLRVGQVVAWHKLADRELLEVIRFELHRAHALAVNPQSPSVLLHHLILGAYRKDLGFAVTEATYRNLLPTQDDLRVGFDLAWQSYGEAAEKFSFADSWCLAYGSSS